MNILEKQHLVEKLTNILLNIDKADLNDDDNNTIMEAYKILKQQINIDNIYDDNNRIFLDTLLKITNPYDLVLVYLALYPEFFNKDKSFFYTYKEGDVSEPAKIMNDMYIQYNIRDGYIFANKPGKEEYVRAHMLELIKQGIAYTKNKKQGGRHYKKSSKTKPKTAVKKPAKATKPAKAAKPVKQATKPVKQANTAKAAKPRK